MPYIAPGQRKEILHKLVSQLSDYIETKADLNYVISLLSHQWVERRGIRYDSLSDVEGTLQCVSKEFYRTVTAPYEDKKRLENGSVSSLDSVGAPINIPSVFDMDHNPPNYTMTKTPGEGWTSVESLTGDLPHE